MVSDLPDLSTERCAGPQIAIWPPSASLMRADPDFTRTSLPLRNTVRICPLTVSTVMGPVTAMAAPSMEPTESPGGGLSGRAASVVNTAINASRIATAAAGQDVTCAERLDDESGKTTPRNSFFSHCRRFPGILAKRSRPILYDDGYPRRGARCAQ